MPLFFREESRVSAPRQVAIALGVLLAFSCNGGIAEDVPEGDTAPKGPAPAESKAETAVKAENIDLKAVVEEPLVPAKPMHPEREASAPKVQATPKPDALEAKAVLPKEVAVIEVQEPLILLNNVVAPGTSTRLGWSPGATFMGIAAPTAVLALNGVNPGPTLCLTAAVHGDELNGIEIVRRLLYDIDPKKLSGEIIGVPIVNLQGFRRGSRYLPDRRDLNRFFPGNPDGSAASRIADSFFTEIVSNCDMLIDMHTGSFRRTNMPQLRADLNNPEVAKLAQKMGAIVVVQSDGSPGTLRRAAVEAGIPAVTLEAGAPHELSKSAIEHGVKSIENALDSLGMVKRRRFWEREAEPIYYESTWIRATDGGILFSEVVLGASVMEGDLLGTVTDPITNRRSEIRAPFAGQIIGMALNQIMFPGFAAYHLGHMPAPGQESAMQLPAPVKGEFSMDDASLVPTKATEPNSADEEMMEEESMDLQPIEDSE